jgi:ABC-type Zn uptake system ZnuABC Zn-binding protein ZnuA
VLASFPPAACFAQNVGEGQAGVMPLCTTIGPHGYQFNISDCAKLRQADLFLANGLSLDDHFTDRMNNNSGNAKLRYVKLADSLPLSLRKKGEQEAHEHGKDGHDHDHDHHHGIYDPHVWLGIPQAIAMVERIRDELKAVDSGHASLYDKNAAAYVARLRALHAEGKKQLAGLKAPVITFHESMGYFADSFGLKVIGAIQTHAGIDPDAKTFRDLVKKCEGQEHVIIAVEPQYPETSAKTLEEALRTKARVGKVSLVVVDPLETCEKDDLNRDWYERKMHQNIDNLAKHAQER